HENGEFFEKSGTHFIANVGPLSIVRFHGDGLRVELIAFPFLQDYARVCETPVEFWRFLKNSFAILWILEFPRTMLEC
ncbi:MAG: hypothetical protein O3A29_22485, partial [Planctomycetota bacterium]|nr:hypothetical protein [Planctomycetota bacterium]